MTTYNSMPTRNLVSAEAAAMMPSPHIPRSRFLGHKTRITTFNGGELIPFYVDEMVPGDHFKLRAIPYVRINTPLFPLFSNFRVDTHFFVCPVRVLWSNFEKMMGAQVNPGDSTSYTSPQISSAAGGFPVGSLWDHFGIPTVGQVAGAGVTTINNFFGRMYNLVYNTWYRDENLIDSAVVETDDGPDTITDYSIRKRAKSPDYFTKALPFAQKGTAPTVPLGTTAPVVGLGVLNGDRLAVAQAGNIYGGGNSATNTGWARQMETATTWLSMTANGGYPVIYADLQQATGISINTLRQAWQIQGLLEQQARFGTRYTEIVKGEFGVNTEDYRLQRPEYVGGGSSPLNISPIAQTAPTTGLTVGALGAAGVATGQHNASYAAREHCFIIGIISVKSELNYQQGIHKMWRRLSRYEWYTPKLADLGEQTVLRNEIYHRGDSNDDIAFGYQARWDEMRQIYSDTSGRMRSTAASTIDPWHAAEKFTAAPTLNATFVNDVPPMARVLAAGQNATDLGMEYIAEILIERDATRPMPTHGQPATIGRF